MVSQSAIQSSCQRSWLLSIILGRFWVSSFVGVRADHNAEIIDVCFDAKL